MTSDLAPSRRRRLVGDRALPPYAYLPGRYPHPVRDPRGHSFGIEPEAPQPPDPQRWWTCHGYLYGIDLFNHGYYWEAHEVWEGLWRACGRGGPGAAFFKALIGLAAAGLKLRAGNLRGAKSHAQRAAGLFHETALEIGSDEARYMGLDLQTLWRWAEDVAGRPHMDGEQESKAGRAVFEFALWPAQRPSPSAATQLMDR